MKLLSFTFLFISILFFGQTQSDTLSYRKYRFETKVYPALLVGYHFSGEAKDNSETWKSGKMHTIELAYAKVFSYGGPHGGSKVYYAGSDLSFSDKYKFFIAPKIGVNVGVGFILGAELQFQTNFEQFVPRIMPYLGIGAFGGKLYAGYNFRLAKAESLPVNTGHIGITWPLLK
ncbi:hypothetical protein F3J23_18410 [Chryseobacterium sp. Tr-659]|uniref:hypothetical protein n=1 Tax=Chryseobacterium sp. Tr-659 TaxID=2608340 RepID=UPI00142081D9|nr:hypothetical protein [Chryseobacterium sp. Tr-659]NIF07397.1 hypothetical protein [Chryseobacterium sp. Tr-659]